MDPKFVAGVICFSTRRKSPVAGPSGEPCCCLLHNSSVGNRKLKPFSFLYVFTVHTDSVTFNLVFQAI